MQNVRQLRVWHLAQRIARDVIDAFPERQGRRVPGLRSQVIRAATSIAANIAEGCGKATREDFLHFLEIALGSLNELDSHLQLARDADVISESTHIRITRDVNQARGMLVSLIRSVQRAIADADLRNHRSIVTR